MVGVGLNRVTNFRLKWLLIYILETLILSGSVFFITILPSVYITVDYIVYLAIALFFISFLIFFLLRGYRKISNLNVLRLLSAQNPVLDHSAELLLQDPSTLTKLELLQKSYLEKKVESKELNFRIPHKLKLAFYSIFITAGAVMFSQFFVDQASEPRETQSISVNDINDHAALISIKNGVKELAVKIIPPKYTFQETITQSDLDIIALEGSVVQWELTFHEQVEEVILKFSDKSELSFNKVGDKLVTSMRLNNRALYELQYVNSIGQTTFSDFHKIDIVYDLPPQVDVKGLDQFTEVNFGGENKFDMDVSIVDDYGISDRYIIATIAQGTGESVMFREDKLVFDTELNSRSKNENLQKQIDLNQFGMQPGDELYFYIETKDNCTLKDNITRTQTYIIAIRDTSNYISAMEGGLGVDLMPEYFRSQRQIIIDTEKLLKDKPTVLVHDFNAKSNALGFDQKALRLKYGQFLGEEDESGIAIQTEEQVEEVLSEEEGGEAEDALDGFKHNHDTEDEHERTNEGEEQEEDPLEEYQHLHDSEEVATFFSNTLKGKLKAAMSLMWDSELYLRLYQPKKALPYQYKALKLIKEIKNHARVYVHRIGFDPPPIKEESRLSGDLSEVNNNKLNAYDTLVDNPSIRKVIQLISGDIESINTLTAVNTRIIQQAGNELAQIAIDNPGKYIFGLQMLRDWINGQKMETNALLQLQNELIKALPNDGAKSTYGSSNLNPLTKTYLQLLEQESNTND